MEGMRGIEGDQSDRTATSSPCRRRPGGSQRQVSKPPGRHCITVEGSKKWASMWVGNGLFLGCLSYFLRFRVDGGVFERDFSEDV